MICYSKTQNKEFSEEIVQDIFISLWRRKDEIVINTSLENYLIKATKLKVVDFYRKKYTQKNNIVVDYDGDLCEGSVFAGSTLEHNEAVYIFLEKDLQFIVNQLPHQCQKVYRLSREKQLKAEEIAHILNISPKTVKNHLTKALGFIKRNLSSDLVK